MTNLFSRLYAYRQTAERRPLEDFLTEAFADVFERLDGHEKLDLLGVLLPHATSAALAAIAVGGEGLRLHTQVALATSGKRPDMVLRLGRRNLLAIEAKIAAGLQRHEIEGADGTGAENRHQLETYARWLAQENASGAIEGCAWAGALVLLTAWTEAPEGFVDTRPDGVVTSVIPWKAVGLWLKTLSRTADPASATGALARDLHAFLRENKLMTKYAGARDLAAAMTYARSNEAFTAVFDDTLDVMAKHVPKLSAGRRLHSGFWSEANIFWAWFHFAQTIRRRPNRPYVAVGICFEAPEVWAADAAVLPAAEPFMFLYCADDNKKEKVDGILDGVPDGWNVIDDGWGIIRHRPVSAFPAPPDERVEALQAWAKHELDRLVPHIPGYESAGRPGGDQRRRGRRLSGGMAVAIRASMSLLDACDTWSRTTPTMSCIRRGGRPKPSDGRSGTGTSRTSPGSGTSTRRRTRTTGVRSEGLCPGT